MVRFGIPIPPMLGGLRIATDIGTMWDRGAGLGLATSRGDLLPSIMDVGRLLAADGAGARVLIMRGRFTARLS